MLHAWTHIALKKGNTLCARRRKPEADTLRADVGSVRPSPRRTILTLFRRKHPNLKFWGLSGKAELALLVLVVAGEWCQGGEMGGRFSSVFVLSESVCLQWSTGPDQKNQTRRTRPVEPDQKNQTSRTRPGPCRPGFSAGVWRPGRVALLCLWPSWSELELVSVVCVVCLMCTVGQLVSNTRKTVYICSNL